MSSPTGSVSFLNDPFQGEREAVSRGPNAHRLLFLTDPLRRAARVAGTPQVRLQIWSPRSTGQVGLALVDYGRSERVLATDEGARTLTTRSCYGDRNRHEDACYRDVERLLGRPRLQVIARGWARLSGRGVHELTVPLTANDVRVSAGHRLGLVIVGASSDWVATLDDSETPYLVFLGATELWLNAPLTFVAGVESEVPRTEELGTGALPVPTRRSIPR